MPANRPPAPAPADVAAVLQPPPPVVEIATRLEDAGFETWCVGGAVRDALLGHRHADWDLATAARPEQVARVFRRIVDVGVMHGTVGVFDRTGVMHEVTTFRRDVRTDGRHADVEFGASLDDDLARRDFTINAMAYSPRRQVLHDPFDGRADLARRVVRAVGVPADRMREDRLRALRAIRFAARFDFTIDDETWQAIIASSVSLTRLSAERVREELTKTMEQVARPSQALTLWRDSGAFTAVLPALGAIDPAILRTLDCLPAPAMHVEPAEGKGGHDSAGAAEPAGVDAAVRAAARAAARAKDRRLIRLAALFLALSSDAVRDALKSLRFSNADTEWIARLVGGWQAVGSEMERMLLGEAPVPDAVVRRWVATTGRLQAASIVRLAAARWSAMLAAGELAPGGPAVRTQYRRVLRAAFHDAVAVSDLQIDGDDLIAAGIAPGREIGEILRRLLTVVLEDQSQNTRERLLALAQVRVADGRAAGERGEG